VTSSGKPFEHLEVVPRSSSGCTLQANLLHNLDALALTIERDFDRQEETKDQIHTICSGLLQVVADEMKETLKERVREGFERGNLTSEIWDELFTVLYAIGDDEQQINLEKRISSYMEALRKTRMKSATDFKDNNPASAPDTEPSLYAIEQDGTSDNF
jgi:hypothetical protein